MTIPPEPSKREVGELPHVRQQPSSYKHASAWYNEGMDTAPDRERLHRFVPRSSVAVPDFTDEVLDALMHLHRRRFMHSAQLEALCGSAIKRDLTKLYNHGYVSRPKAQWVWRCIYRRLHGAGGSSPLVYAEATRSASLLARMGYIEPNGRDYAERNRELSEFSLFMPHELQLSDVYVGFHLACRAHASISLHYADKYVCDGYDADALPIPGAETWLEPDWPFFLDGLIDEPSLLFLELDRVTEPNGRHSYSGLRSIRQKFESYLAYGMAKGQLQQFGVNNFRVLTITTGGEIKMHNIADTAKEVCGGKGGARFLTTTFERFKEHGPLAVQWLDASGQEIVLGT
jgi:hypothetical protein